MVRLWDHAPAESIRQRMVGSGAHNVFGAWTNAGERLLQALVAWEIGQRLVVREAAVVSQCTQRLCRQWLHAFIGP
jgi:hypothetical protein